MTSGNAMNRGRMIADLIRYRQGLGFWMELLQPVVLLHHLIGRQHQNR